MKQIVDIKKEKNLEKKHEIEKWFQVLLIPSVLVFTSYILDAKGQIGEKLFLILGVYLLTIIVYIGVIGFWEFTNFVSTIHINHMESFLSDLQGVLDRSFFIDNADLI